MPLFGVQITYICKLLDKLLCIMDQLLKKYCLNDNANGLMLLDMPTGIGKTHNVVQFIKEYLRSNPARKVFFVTTLKKNVESPYEQLYKEIEGDPDLSDKLIHLLSNKDYVKEHFGEIKSAIQKNKEIGKSEEYRMLSSLIDAQVSTEVLDDPERKFRQLVSKCLSKKCKTVADKIYTIKNDNEWKWVGELYPVVFSSEKQVFFATMKKLIYQFDMLVDKPTRLYENDIFRDSILFIDEFDATKKDIQDMIVDNGIKHNVDYLDLFHNIKICLDNQSTIPSNIFDNVENKPSHQDAFEKNVRLFSEIDNEHRITLHHKSVGFEEERVVLFSDLTHNNYTTNEKNVKAELDKKANVVKLSLVGKEEPDRSLYEALDKIKGAIAYFTRFISILSYSFYVNRKGQAQNEAQSGEFTLNHAVDTVLDSLHLQGEAYSVIRSHVISRLFKHYKKKNVAEESLCDDITFYDTGFSHYDFVDDYSHDNTTVIRKFDFEETPEGIMFDICSHAKVVGISATATYNTVLGNYDIEYLKWKLGDMFYEPSMEDRERLRKTFDGNITGYNKVEWNVSQTHTSSKERPDWSRIFNDPDAIDYFSQQLSNVERKSYNEKEESHYNEVRYFKLALAYKMFEENNIQSFLSLLSKAVDFGKADSKLSYEMLDKLFDAISRNLGKKYDRTLMCVLSSDNFENEKETLRRDLGDGKRIFIISTYATLGAGQNLQYKIPASRKDVVAINEFRGLCDEMDIEGIFLDKPTMIINLCDGDEINSINRVYQMEYLYEKRAISHSTKMLEIKNSYDCINRTGFKLKRDNTNFYALKDYKVCATKIIVQGMGRKCRTPMRGKTIYILADSEIGDVLDEATLYHEGRMFNPEMIKLAELFKLNGDEAVDVNRTLQIAKEDAWNSNKKIQSYLNRCFESVWNDDDIKLWQGMREYALKHPTLSKEEWLKSPYKYHYIHLGRPVNRYYFKQSGDFDTVTNISIETIQEACQMSFEEVGLNTYLESSPDLRKLFLTKGYAMEFQENEYVMSPPFYQNIYKGALGEEIGKFFFGLKGIELDELDAKEYEMFDYKIAGKPIYVDFKYWKESSLFNAERYHNKVLEKSAKCQGIEWVFIINVRDTGNKNVNTFNMGELKILETSLICDGRSIADATRKIMEIYGQYKDQ